jgi:hypothetical protein
MTPPSTPGDLCIFRAPDTARERLPVLSLDVLDRPHAITVSDQLGTTTVKSGDLVEIMKSLSGTYRLARLPGVEGLLLIDAQFLTLYHAAQPTDL